MLVIWVLTLFLLRISGIDVNIGKESKVLVPNILHLIHLNGGEFNLAELETSQNMLRDDLDNSNIEDGEDI